jgi:hypothetical protein
MGLHVGVLHHILGVHGTHGHRRATTGDHVRCNGGGRTNRHGTAAALDWVGDMKGLELVKCRRGIVWRGRRDRIDLKIRRRRSLLCKIWHRTVLLGIEGTCRRVRGVTLSCLKNRVKEMSWVRTCIWGMKLFLACIVSVLYIILRVVRQRSLPEVAVGCVLSLRCPCSSRRTCLCLRHGCSQYQYCSRRVPN